MTEHDCDRPDCDNPKPQTINPNSKAPQSAEVSVRDLSQVWYRLEPISQFGHLNDPGSMFSRFRVLPPAGGEGPLLKDSQGSIKGFGFLWAYGFRFLGCRVHRGV